MTSAIVAGAIGGGVSLAALVYALVLQRLLWQARLAHQQASSAMSIAGERLRELGAELQQARSRHALQLETMEAEIADLERYLDGCDASPYDSLRVFATLQALRDAAAKLGPEGSHGLRAESPTATIALGPVAPSTDV